MLPHARACPITAQVSRVALPQQSARPDRRDTHADDGEALFVEVVVDLVEAVSREREHQEERFRAGAAQRVLGIGRNIGGETGPDVSRD